MKRFALSLFLLSAAAFAEEARVVTFNIRLNTFSDGPDAWPNRKEAVAKLIRERADLAGLQEVKPEQRAWLKQELPEFEFVGIGRHKDDKDESVPVVFRRDRFEVLSSGTFWLSNTPEVVESTSWGNKIPRICTWVKLKDRKDGRAFWFYNVHLDHQSGEAREKGLALVADRIAAQETKEPAVMAGDLNCSADDVPVVSLLKREQPAFRSTYELLGVPPEGTFHGFSGKPRHKAIDYIFVEKGRLAVKKGTVLKTTYKASDGAERFVSDHFPVEAVIEFEK